MILRVWLLSLLFWLIGLTAANAAPLPVDVSTLQDQPLSLTTRFQILEDPGGRLTLDDVRRIDIATGFRSVDTPNWSLNFGVTPSAYWLRLPLTNPSARRFDGMVEFMFPRLAADVQMYRPTSTSDYQRFETGFLHPFSTRPYAHHFYVLPVEVASNSEQVLYCLPC